MAEETQPKWEGKATVELKESTADQIWSFVADFCNVHKWFPSLDTCYRVEGEAGQPGLIRYCASSTQIAEVSSKESKPVWAKEKLLMIDPLERCISYEILDNNIGFKSYVATWKLFPLNGDYGKPGCKFEWSFVSDPIEGFTALDAFNSYIDSVLQFMARKMEQDILFG